MKSIKNFSALISAILALLILISACDKERIDAIDEIPQERVIVDNNSASLSSRVNLTNLEIGIQNNQPTGLGSVASPDEGVVHFINPIFDLKAEIATPDELASELSATHILIEGDYAFVSYHVRGITYGGGFEILNISNPSSIQILSQVIYRDTDINSIAIDDDSNKDGSAFDIYLAGANGRGAVIEKMRFEDGQIIEESEETLQLNGVNANGLIRTKHILYVTVGGRNGDGGLVAVDLRSGNKHFTEMARDQFANAKAIVADGTDINDKFYVLQGGANAHIYKYKIQSNGIKREKDYAIDAINTLDGKNSISLRGDLLFVAMSEQGIQVFDKDKIKDGPEYEVNLAGLGGKGLSNGIVTDEDHVYIANGSSGLHIADVPNKNSGLVVNGALDMDGSANYVAANNKVILVANGLGGVKAIARKASEAELDIDELSIVYQSFRKQGKSEYKGGRYGGADINQLKDPAVWWKKNQIQIPIDDLETLNEIHLEIKAEADYKVFIYMAAEKSEYTEQIREYNIEKNAGYVKKSSIELNKKGFKYIIISAVPNGNAYGRAYLKDIQIKGLK